MSDTRPWGGQVSDICFEGVRTSIKQANFTLLRPLTVEQSKVQNFYFCLCCRGQGDGKVQMGHLGQLET
jgi:hypothetical protein